MQVEEVAFDLRGTVEGVAKLLSPLAKSKGLAFESVFSPEVPRNTKGDPLRIRQVLLNLVANAIKFTEKGKIRIEVLTGGDQSAGTAILFRVIDSGIGINPQIVNRLFDPFTQADAGTTRKYGGTGLGLAISRRLVMLMGGSIGVESTPGEGSTFWFVIPIEATPDASRDQAPTESLPIASPDAPANITLQPADVLPALPVPSMPGRILIVDENPVNQLVAVRAVNNIGYDTCTAAGGEAALEAIETTRFDLILMDCQMPGMDGYQTTVEIRRREGSSRRIPIVAMTANAIDGDQERCIAAGMDDYLTKPIRMATLGKTLQRWISQPELCHSAARTNPAA
jgi:CheY-like chemotaxis protein